MSPWWLRPTSEGDDDRSPEKHGPSGPASLSQHTDPLPDSPSEEALQEPPIAASRRESQMPLERGPFDRSLFAEDEYASAPAPVPSAAPADRRAVEALDAFAAPSSDGPYESAAGDDADDEADDAHEGDDFDSTDDEAGDEPASGEAGEAGDVAGGERKRRRRGGRRRRGKNGNGAHAPAPGTPGEGVEIAAAPGVAPIERPRERSERSERAERPERAERADRPERAERAERRPSVVELPPVDFAANYAQPQYAREIIVERAPQAQQEEAKIALFCDLENVALGVRDSEIKKFDIDLVLERLLEKGKIIVKKAYCDWERYSEYKRAFHESAIELIDIPQKHYSGKNSADIKMVVDAMDLSYSKEHLDTFVLLSGDSDFSPLVSKLKENNKRVIGIGVKNSSSSLLIDNCDEFLFYEDIWREQQKGPEIEGMSKKQAEVFALMIDSIQALMRENKDVLWGSMIKQTMKRKKPSFNESYYGYSTFSEVLQDAEKKGIIKLRKDQRSGSLVVIGFASVR